MRLNIMPTFALVLLLATPALPQGYAPAVAPAKMDPAAGLAVGLYAAEPDVRQPICVKFDDQGRLWTIQYLQYPNPAGLKRVKVDRFSRTVYDRVPEPPPHGPKGDDRITICEDTDGDGRADRFKDFVTGLNLATGLAFGHGGVYVLQAPYLLFYPDRDRNDVPDADPEVVLSGFGLEDAQSMVNHLTWGPDGWLYGVTGSTATNRVRDIEFQQAVWRVHPISKKFELFCEGGGNLFGLTFDADGNLFFSSNGIDLAYHAVQGAYYRKNFGKHGPLHNPYAYGFFEHLPYDHEVAGPRPGGTIYLGNTLPDCFRGALLCCEFLQHSAAWWRLERQGTTFAARYGGRLVDSRDTWFCACDLCQGPDGAIYLCDFHDQRTAHPDPDARWDRSNGRIYRVALPGTYPARGIDLSRKTGADLVALLSHPNGWYAEQARTQLAARRDPAVHAALAALARQHSDPRRALQALWGLYVSGGFDETVATDLLGHPSEYVRAWTLRLLGDEGKMPAGFVPRLAALAASDPSAAVRCQLAATARRLPGAQGLPLIEALLARGLDRDDPYLPLMVWWAVESKALTDTDRLVRVFGAPTAWDDPGYREQTLRLVRRYAAAGNRTGYDVASRLLATAPPAHQAEVLEALERGLAERAVAPGGMGRGDLFGAVASLDKAPPSSARGFEPLTPALTEAIATAWRAAPADLLRARLALRAGVAGASSSVLAEAAAPATLPARRRVLLGLLAELGSAESVPAALALVQGGQPLDVRTAALDVVTRHGDARALDALLDLYSRAPAGLQARLRETLLSRASSAGAFLERVDRKEIAASDIPVESLRVVSLHGDPKLDALVRKHWGSIQAGTAEEKLAEMRRLTNDLRAGAGDPVRGRELFRKQCATCHKLFGAGGEIGPDLTGVARNDTTALLANIVDPSAVIRAQYLQYAAVTTTGRTLAGIVVQQDNGGVTLLDARNQRTTLRRDEIEELRELPTSIMPEDLLKALSPQEVRDLFRFVQGGPM
ncbi:MAG: c-type cytochrome [Isosphaeraceae bacterium]|nr:c-type cytochrome [Isosphaeraceae bacterium]